MPQLRYSVAASLDGFIAGPNGEFDWIPMDPDIDFAAMYAAFGHLVMGRHSYDVFVATGGVPGGMPLPVTVCSTSLPEGARDGVTFVRDAVSAVRALKAAPGDTPIWLWGGSNLFGALAAAGLVDGVDVAIVPMILGSGIPLAPPAVRRLRLGLKRQRVYPKSGIVMAEYDVGRLEGLEA
jgi:dihydrofolate reductase